MSKAIVDLKEFQAAVKRVSAVMIKTSTTFEILRYLLKLAIGDGVLMLATTDQYVTYNAFVDCNGSDWDGYIKASQLEPILRYKPKGKTDLTIEYNDNSIVFRADSIVVTCNQLNKEDADSVFTPKVFDKEYKKSIRITKDECKKFKAALVCVSKDETRIDFTGAAFMDRNIVSTDGHRLYKGVCQNGDESFRGIMQPKLMKAIADGLTGELYERKQKSGGLYHVLLADNGDIIISESIAGQFPDFSRVIPRHWNGQATIDKHIYEIIKTYAAGFKDSHICFLDDETVIRQIGKRGANETRHFPRIEGMPNGLAVNTQYFLNAIEPFLNGGQFYWLDMDSPMWIGEPIVKDKAGTGTVVMPVQL